MVDHSLNSVVETLAYFDIFDFPLTKEELYRLLWRPPPGFMFTDLVITLEEYVSCGLIVRRHGYYMLPGREEIMATRESKIIIIEKKLAIARRAARKLRWIPFVEAIYVANTVAAGVASAESDIDVFVVIKHTETILKNEQIFFHKETANVPQTFQYVSC